MVLNKLNVRKLAFKRAKASYTSQSLEMLYCEERRGEERRVLMVQMKKGRGEVRGKTIDMAIPNFEPSIFGLYRWQ